MMIMIPIRTLFFPRVSHTPIHKCMGKYKRKCFGIILVAMLFYEATNSGYIYRFFIMK